MKTKVIFRKWPKEGNVIIALFPTEAGTNDPYTCSSYQHVGQHGSASVDLMRETVPAYPDEYAPLKAELERIGYDLKIGDRFTRADFLARKEQIAK